MIVITLLIVHGLTALGLMGALTHQVLGELSRARPRLSGAGFAGRYTAVAPRPFTGVILILYIATILPGALIYPTYRLDVRPAFEDMGLAWAVGLFELKEHGGAIGLAALPLYARLWRKDGAEDKRWPRLAITLLLATIVWFDFIAGHLLNNLRGL